MVRLRIKEINKLDLNLEDVEGRHNSDNSDFYKFTPPSKLASIKDLNIIYTTVF